MRLFFVIAFEILFISLAISYTRVNNQLAYPLLEKNFTGLPPVYIAAMALDPVRDHRIELANRLREVGQEYYLTM
ncbi:MAG: alpha/beta hydrolase fold domain-containing protein [Nitrososphaeraceae archaeon]